MDALSGGAAGWWPAQKLPVLKTILDFVQWDLNVLARSEAVYIALHDVFIIYALTAKNKWHFSLSAHSFQLDVNAGHLGESKQIFFFHFFPLLLYIVTYYKWYFRWQSISSDDTLENMHALKKIKIKIQEQFSCCRLVCNTEKLKINKANLGIAQWAHFLWNYWERSPWGQLSRNAS